MVVINISCYEGTPIYSMLCRYLKSDLVYLTVSFCKINTLIFDLALLAPLSLQISTYQVPHIPKSSIIYQTRPLLTMKLFTTLATTLVFTLPTLACLRVHGGITHDPLPGLSGIYGVEAIDNGLVVCSVGMGSRIDQDGHYSL